MASLQVTLTEVAGCGRVDGYSFCWWAAASRNALCCRNDGVGPTLVCPQPNLLGDPAVFFTFALCYVVFVGKTRLLLWMAGADCIPSPSVHVFC